jgi:tetratricopeptide (TPR) repeat protein
VWAVLAGLAVTAFYALAPRPEALTYDDELLVSKDLRPRSLGDLAHALTEPHYEALPYYRPVARVSYLVQKAVHGDAPVPFRLLNALLIGLLVPLVYLVLRRPAFGVRSTPALLAAVIFVVHPVASSCVYPIAGRETLLPALFGALCVHAWLHEGRGWHLLAAVALAAALFSKEHAVVLPALLVLADALALGARPRGVREWAVRYTPVAAIVVFYFAVRAIVLDGTSLTPAVFSHPEGPLQSVAFAIQTLVAPRMDLFYEPVWPAWFSAVRFAMAAGVCALLVAGAVRHRALIGRRALFWLGWVGATLLPAANLIVQETRFDERYLLLPWLGVAALAATVASAAWDRRATRLAAFYGGVALIVALATISHGRARFYREPLVFHEQWARTRPGSANAHNGLGVALARRGRTEEAIEHYREAIRLRADHPHAHGNLGLALVDAGAPDDALERFRRAIDLRPDYAEAHYNLANLLSERGRSEEAERHYREALRIRPYYVEALNNYGALFAARGRTAEALDLFARVIEIDPGHARARVNSGILLARDGRYEDAVSHYRAALDVAPGYTDAHFDLGAALEALGRNEEAGGHFREAARLARAEGRFDFARIASERASRIAGVVEPEIPGAAP